MSPSTCPACTAPGLVVGPHGTLECPYCGAQVVAKPTTCPACGQESSRGDERCLNCGEPLTGVWRVLSRFESPGAPLWLRQTRARASELKAMEARASQKRLEALEEIDRRRETAAAEAQARQREQDLRIIRGTVIAVGLILIALLAAALALRG